MSNVTIGRYSDDEVRSHHHSGWIEGSDDSGQRWILYLDATGRPQLYWPQREDDGAVIGDPVQL